MIRSALNFLYGSTPAVFDSSFSLEESIRRLEAATKSTSFTALTAQRAVGRVREDKVLLQRVIPFVQNSFKPVYVGRFIRTRAGVRLEGRFTMHWFVKGFMTYWFGFSALWVGLAAASVVRSESPEQWWLPLAGVGMLSFGAGLVGAGKYFARNDIAWLSGVIRSALAAEVRPNGIRPSRRAQ